jgi:DNA-binding MarR family transcriptional regulator
MNHIPTPPADGIALDEVQLDLDSLPDLLGFHLRLAQTAVTRDFSATLAEIDLTQKQCATMELIGANPGVSQVDLAALLGSDRATMMAIVDRLEARDFVSRTRSAADRRRQHLNLTDAGQTMLVQAKELIAEHEHRFKRRFSDAELDALVSSLRRIHQQF